LFLAPKGKKKVLAEVSKTTVRFHIGFHNVPYNTIVHLLFTSEAGRRCYAGIAMELDLLVAS